MKTSILKPAAFIALVVSGLGFRRVLFYRLT